MLTSTQLADKLSAILATEIKAFLDAPSPDAAKYQADIESARQQAEVATHPVVANAIKQAIQELEAAKPNDSLARRQEAALAVLAVTDALQLPLGIKGVILAEANPAKEKGTRHRMSRAQMKQLAETVLNAIPASGDIGIVDLAAKAGASVADTRSVLLRLKREGKVAPSGVRGRGAGWKRSEG